MHRTDFYQQELSDGSQPAECFPADINELPDCNRNDLYHPAWRHRSFRWIRHCRDWADDGDHDEELGSSGCGKPVLRAPVCIRYRAGDGLLITGFDLPPFIATLGMMSIARGAAYTITEGQPIYTFPKEFLAITGRYGGIPVFTILIMIVMFVIAAYVLKYTKYGRYIYAIGGNENCAKLSGINVKKIKCIAYVISGFCCGVAAIVLTSRLDSAVPTNADGAELDAIAAVVIGGTSMNGGEGTLVGTIIGTMIIGIVANGLNLLNVPQGAQRMVKGGMAIVLAVIVDVIRRKRSQKA